ncbi:MAG: hypothetical protein HC894_30850 [Microcoleus sp. SM1_3_4]|nr:hypothetical protein [Microcoleus sp. SM1_3_4]
MELWDCGIVDCYRALNSSFFLLLSSSFFLLPSSFFLLPSSFVSTVRKLAKQNG